MKLATLFGLSCVNLALADFGDWPKATWTICDGADCTTQTSGPECFVIGQHNSVEAYGTSFRVSSISNVKFYIHYQPYAYANKVVEFGHFENLLQILLERILPGVQPRGR